MSAIILAFPTRPERRRVPVMIAARRPQPSLWVFASLGLCMAAFAPGVLLLVALLWGVS